jgi:hypothetical protein
MFGNDMTTERKNAFIVFLLLGRGRFISGNMLLAI